MREQRDWSDDREEWDRIWGTVTQHRLPPGIQLDLGDDQAFGRVGSVAISEDPPQFSDRVWRETAVCPVCGCSTVGMQRVAATVHLAFDSGFQLGKGVWVHRSCFESCPDTGQPAPIPW